MRKASYNLFVLLYALHSSTYALKFKTRVEASLIGAALNFWFKAWNIIPLLSHFSADGRRLFARVSVLRVWSNCKDLIMNLPTAVLIVY